MPVWSILTQLPLVFCSVFALTIILERLSFYVRSAGKPEALEPGGVTVFSAEEEAKHCWFRDTLHALMAHRDDERSLRDDVVSLYLQRDIKRLKARLSGLATLAALAPILGLLGTIVGLMHAFRDIGQSEGPVEPAMIADGLWIALSTTAAGLVIAVVCLVAHAAFSSLVRRRTEGLTFVLNRASIEMEAKRAA